ncbi:MAG: hypothetical protein GXO49_04940 [Chlorobi bacterium]|nr:hypothetical protein [Chlorobiota bacterium]
MKNIFYISVLVLLFASSCKNKNNKYDVDVSNINIKIKTKHFEKDLFKFNVDSSDFYINYYKQKYGEFFKLFNYQIVEMGSCEDPNYGKNLDLFVRYWKTEGMFDVLKKEFPNFDKEQLPKIEDAFKHYKYYFPNNYIPEIYTFFSSFGYSVVTLDSVMGVGIDKYLGWKNFNLYDKVGFSMYQKRRMTKEMIPVDLMRSIAESDYPFDNTNSDNFLDNIIYEGKMQYYLNCMLPNTADTLKWRYTEKQLSWAVKYETKIWNYIAEKRLLFSTDKNEIRKFVGDAPYTSIFADVSAPRAGAFIGFKIVENYMIKNPKISLKELMEEKDARKILAGAKYNP